MKDNSSLPPRSTIHTPQGIEKSGGNKIIRVFFSSFVFIIIIALILFFVFSDIFRSNAPDNELEGNDPSPAENSEVVSDIDNQPNQDNIIIDIDPNESDQDVGEDVIVDDVTTVPTETPITSGDVTHIVKDGENLYKISFLYYGHGYMEELAKYNNIVDSDYLTVGTVLKIPNKELLK